MLESLGAIIWVIGAGAWVAVVVKVVWLGAVALCVPAAALLLLRGRRSRR